MAHRPITNESAGANGSDKGAGGVELGPSNDHGGDGARVDQVVVPTASPRPRARDKDAVHPVRHRGVNERPSPRNLSTGCGNILWCRRWRRLSSWPFAASARLTATSTTQHCTTTISPFLHSCADSHFLVSIRFLFCSW